MKSVKGHQEEEEMEEELEGRKDARPSSSYTKDTKNNEKANATRSKHSVTEQRRRSKINERFQILRELIPNSDKKRDTASFLLEVIQHVQYLQDKVQKFEGSFQNWNSESTKLMPWRNSRWGMQGSGSQPHVAKNDIGSGVSCPGRFDDVNISMPSSSIHPNQQIQIENGVSKDASRAIDQNELVNQTRVTQLPLPQMLPVSLQNDDPFCHSQARLSSHGLLGGPVALDVVNNPEELTVEGGNFCHSQAKLSSHGQLAEPIARDAVNNPDELTVEGGTISISSIYSQGLLNTLTEALQNTGLDLSQATISVQINLGKQSNEELLPGLFVTRDPENPMSSNNNQIIGNSQDTSNGGDLNQAQKRLKT